MPDTFAESLRAAVKDGRLLESSARHVARLLGSARDPVALASVRELIDTGNWTELNDRFFTTLAFGTGGLRGRTIGKTVTRAEQGAGGPGGRPEFPCVGTNAMNYENVARATRGLAAYLRRHFEKEGRAGRPKLVIANDTRHFSTEFRDLAARTAAEGGVDVLVFDGPRSTPELSFAVRHTLATSGIVLTASHNPPHDNGYKVYWEDGAQIVEPHASGIIAEVNAASDAEATLPDDQRGTVSTLGPEVDEAYLARLQTLVLDPAMFAAQRESLKIVFTPIHGTGGVSTLPAFERLGVPCLVVAEQAEFDGRFPTVKSPNPENAEALAMGTRLAEKEGADAVIATDPDADRLGAAVRGPDGRMQLLTGNQIAALIAHHRVETLWAQGVLTPENIGRAAVVKTFVTTDLLSAIAARRGVRCVDTLTGFKYIGQKMGRYEAALPDVARSVYRSLTEAQTRAERLQHSTYCVFGGEESYGYSGADFARDKDANGSAVMFAEMCAAAKASGQTVAERLDAIFAEYGCFAEQNGAIQMEGAEGATRIQKLLASYADNPPRDLDGDAVRATKDFDREEFHDVEGEKIPREKMLIFELESGGKVAVRGSGTEPKIKYYLFVRRNPPAGGKFGAEELTNVKREIADRLEKLWAWLQADAQRRV